MVNDGGSMEEPSVILLSGIHGEFLPVSLFRVSMQEPFCGQNVV